MIDLSRHSHDPWPLPITSIVVKALESAPGEVWPEDQSAGIGGGEGKAPRRRP